MVALDDGPRSLVDFWDPNPHSGPCDPTSDLGMNATAEPQNPLINDRVNALCATPLNEMGWSFLYEAHWPRSSGAEDEIIGYYGSYPVPGCDGGNYELVSVPKVGQAPKYERGWDGQNWVPSKQAIVGDAMWKTQLTMEVFDELGWPGGFDRDDNTPAMIVIDASCSSWMVGNSFFNYPQGAWGPINALMICPLSDDTPIVYPQGPTIPGHGQEFSSAASLDVIAHEWAHGLQFQLGLPRNSDTARELHEGWSDVIGHAVEWKKEPSGSAAETRDWDLDEDSKRIRYGRTVNIDDGHLGVIGGPLDPDDNPNSYHLNDPCSTDGPHFCGLRLAVAFWLVADGETENSQFDNKNPVCQRGNVPAGVDCDLEVTALGTWKATRIFFRALTTYVDSTDGWEQLAELVKRSAHDLYATDGGCSNAYFEQDSVQDAFSAIGYPGLTPSHRYCIVCGCAQNPPPGS